MFLTFDIEIYLALSPNDYLDVTMDSDWHFDSHIKSVTKSAYHHLKNVARLRRLMSTEDLQKLAGWNVLMSLPVVTVHNVPSSPTPSTLWSICHVSRKWWYTLTSASLHDFEQQWKLCCVVLCDNTHYRIGHIGSFHYKWTQPPTAFLRKTKVNRFVSALGSVSRVLKIVHWDFTRFRPVNTRSTNSSN